MNISMGTKFTRKDFEIMLGKEKKAKSYSNRIGAMFAVRSYKVS